MLYFVSLRDRIFILFLLMTLAEYLFPKNHMPLRIKLLSPKRYIGGSPSPLLSKVIDRYKSILTWYFQFRPCHFSFYHVLNYVSLSFDISREKNWFLNPILFFWKYLEISGSTSEIHVHCRTVWTVVNCWRRYSNLCGRLCKLFHFWWISVSGLHVIKGDLHILKKTKQKKGTHYILYHFCSMRLGFVVSWYLLGTIMDSQHYFL